MNAEPSPWLTTREAATLLRMSLPAFRRNRSALGIDVSFGLGRTEPRYPREQVEWVLANPAVIERSRRPLKLMTREAA